MRSDELAPHHRLRSYAAFLVVLGWMHVAAFVLAGFLPWLTMAETAVSALPPWEQWLVYAAPAGGLLIGAMTGLAYFIVSGVLRVLLDQRDLLEELLRAQQGGPRQAHEGAPESRLSRLDSFDFSAIKETDGPSL